MPESLEKGQEIHGRPGSKAEDGPGADPQRRGDAVQCRTRRTASDERWKRANQTSAPKALLDLRLFREVMIRPRPQSRELGVREGASFFPPSLSGENCLWGSLGGGTQCS